MVGAADLLWLNWRALEPHEYVLQDVAKILTHYMGEFPMNEEDTVEKFCLDLNIREKFKTFF
jgi:hypothetical protein